MPGAGPAALEGQALDPGLAVRLRAVEGGAPGAGVAAGVRRRRVARGLRLGGVAGGLRGLRVGLGCRAGGASGHRFLSSFVGLTADFVLAGCRSSFAGSPLRRLPGRSAGTAASFRRRGCRDVLGATSGPADRGRAAGPVGSAGACVGASRNDLATPRTLRRWGSRVKPKNTRCSGTCGGRVATSGGLGRFARFHARPTLGAWLSTLGARLSTSRVAVVHAIGGVVHRVRTGRPRAVHRPVGRRRYRTSVLSAGAARLGRRTSAARSARMSTGGTQGPVRTRVGAREAPRVPGASPTRACGGGRGLRCRPVPLDSAGPTSRCVPGMGISADPSRAAASRCLEPPAHISGRWPAAKVRAPRCEDGRPAVRDGDPRGPDPARVAPVGPRRRPRMSRGRRCRASNGATWKTLPSRRSGGSRRRSMSASI